MTPGESRSSTGEDRGGCRPSRPAGTPHPRRWRTRVGHAATAIVVCLATVTACEPSGAGHDKVVASQAVARAVAGTVHSGSARFSLTVGLSKSLATFLGDAATTSVSGTGQLDFTRHQASWVVDLPPSLGSSVRVIADGGTTYVSYARLSAPGRPAWIELSSDADYSSFDTVPWIRDLVVLTNPMHVLDLVDSTPGSPHTISRATTPTADDGHPVVLARWDSGVVEPGACIPTIASSGNWTGDVAGAISAGVKAEDDAMKAWAGARVSADASRGGVCDAKISVENPDGLGFDVSVSISKQAIPVTVAGVKGMLTVSFSQTLHETRQPCWVGTWSGTTNATVPAAGDFSALSGEGTVDLKLSDPKVLDNATMNTDEDFNGTEAGSNFGLGIAYGTQEVHYHREIVAIGTVATSSAGITILAHGTISLNESGAIVGSRSATFIGRSLLLDGTYDCSTMKLYGEQTAYRLHKVSGAPAASISVGTSSLSVNWRPVAGQDGNPVTAPTTPTTLPPASPPSVGLGAGPASWNANHVADPQVPNAYDLKPGRYPGSYFQDEFLDVTFVGGKLESYAQQLAPSTTQSQASATVRAYLPHDATVVIPATDLGTCTQETLQSPSLAAAEGSGSGGISVVYGSDYASSSKSYDASDVRTALVTIQPGGLPQSASDLSSMACG